MFPFADDRDPCPICGVVDCADPAEPSARRWVSDAASTCRVVRDVRVAGPDGRGLRLYHAGDMVRPDEADWIEAQGGEVERPAEDKALAADADKAAVGLTREELEGVRRAVERGDVDVIDVITLAKHRRGSGTPEAQAPEP